MASRTLASTSLLLCLNLVFFTLVSSTYVPCPPPPQTPSSGHHGGHHDGHHGGHHDGGHHGGHYGGGHHGGGGHQGGSGHQGGHHDGSGHQGGHQGSGGHQGGYGGSPSQGGYGGSPSTPTTPTTPTTQGKCPMDALKLGVCANVLNDLVHLVVGNPPKTPCCPLIGGLVDLEAAVCLCTALKANILGINLNVPISLSLLLNYCGKGVPAGFQCP